VLRGREQARAIIRGEDIYVASSSVRPDPRPSCARLFNAQLPPCQVADRIVIVMRVYVKTTRRLKGHQRSLHE
jgi:hypothetical protein